jgi:hypothetical protein
MQLYFKTNSLPAALRCATSLVAERQASHAPLVTAELFLWAAARFPYLSDSDLLALVQGLAPLTAAQPTN